MIYKKNQSKIMRKSLQLLLFSLFLYFSVYSQAGTSSVTGTIADGQGNIVPGASVTLISEQNSRRTTVTNESGTYSFVSVQPGNYKIEVEAKSFKKASLSSFQALVDKQTTINVTLEVGQVTETVNVDTTGVENIINTQDAKLGANFVSKQILQLPLQGRNVSTLLSLQANVTPDGSVAGGRADQANITLDGLDVNNQQDASAFSPVLRVNPDTVDEFRVTTSNPDATQGRSSGAQISLITKSGSNEFHGALYEYHRNTATTANNYFNNKAGRYVATDSNVINGRNKVGDLKVPRPPLLRNLFGGRIGGPIIKDRLFFFYNYEGLREAKATAVTRTVPLPSLGQGIVKFRDNANNLRTFDTATINGLTSTGLAVVDVNPFATAVLLAAANKYAANDTTVGDGLNTSGFRFNAPAPVKQNGHTARFDWNVTRDGKHIISLRGNYQQDISGGVPNFPDTPPTNTWSHPLGLGTSYTWLISNNKTNRFSFGLTRLAFSNQGDSDQNAITFRSVLSPALYSRTFNRVNPTQNFTDDFTWIKGDHSIQLGTNIRVVRNKRSNFGAAYDSAVVNYSYYQSSGGVVMTPINQYLAATYGTGTAVSSAWTTNLGYAITALFGRLSQYSANYNFGLDGNPLKSGDPVVREWATEEYDWYAQDTWRFRPNLTITGGLRYGLSRPVYETQGFQVAPNIPLQEYLERRIAASAQGTNYDTPLIMELAGPKNNAKDFYKMDKNNFQPSIAVAWSPKFESGFLKTLFGENNSTIRGGFRITNDYFGQQLAVTFDSLNKLGFSTSRDISANAYNILDCAIPTSTCRPAPLYTGPTMAIKTLQGMTAPANLAFPQQQPANNSRRIETSLDTNLQSPINYSWNISYTRQLPSSLVIDVSYVGRIARHLLATRDVMSPNNLRDPKSGQTYYEAATILEKQRQAGVSVSQIQPIPFFENMYTPGSIDTAFAWNSGYTNTQAVYAEIPYAGDWTYIQEELDNYSGKRLFYQSQYGALSSFGTIGSSDYHGASLSVRQRLKGLTWDLNYTFSKSMDDASGLQTGGTFGSAFILNALRQQDARSVSDFDLTHVVNFNSVWEIPLGKGQKFLSGMNKVLNGILGGWQLSTIYRYNTGYPIYGFFDNSGWQTNWNIRSNGVRVTQVNPSPNANSGQTGVPNLFSDPKAAYQSYRTPYPGESGDRNQLRYPSSFNLDAGLAKSFGMPWSENHKAQIRWEVFNVTNSAQFTGLANTALGYNPSKGLPASTFGNFTATQGSARVMQFAFRYDF